MRIPRQEINIPRSDPGSSLHSASECAVVCDVDLWYVLVLLLEHIHHGLRPDVVCEVVRVHRSDGVAVQCLEDLRGKKEQHFR